MRQVNRGVFAGTLTCLLAATGCEGAGEGAVDGTLFLRGCPAQDPTDSATLDVPNPLPSYSMGPRYFFGEVMRSIQQGWTESNRDPRGVDNMHIRLQRDSGKAERSDTFDLFIYDMDKYPAIEAAALARGEQGAPILPPDLDGNFVPLPGDPAASVRAAVNLNVTCWFPRVTPLLRGWVRFSSLGKDLDDEIAGEFSVTLEDARATRQMTPPDAAGALSGWFRFPLRSGPVVPGL